MSQEGVLEAAEAVEGQEAVKPQPTYRKKRDIFRFNGQEDMSINLEHVHKMTRKEKRITFQFPATADFVDFEDEAAAKNAYEQLLTVWASDVLA